MLQILWKIKWQLAQFFEIRWWQHYLKKKNDQKYLHWKKNYWQGILNLAESISHEPHQSIIRNADQPGNIIWDAGCGPAGIFIFFDKAKILATDPLLKDYSSKNLLFSSNKENVKFYNSAMENTELPGQCDLVFCMNALNHVRDLDKATEKLQTNLKSNGVLVCTLDCHRYNLLKHIFRLIPGDVLHPHQYNLEDYIDLFKKFDLKTLATSRIKNGKIFDHYLLLIEKP